LEWKPFAQDEKNVFVRTLNLAQENLKLEINFIYCDKSLGLLIAFASTARAGAFGQSL
jgi:hypothetical protein